MAQRLLGADGRLENGRSYNTSQRLLSSNVSFKRKISSVTVDGEKKMVDTVAMGLGQGIKLVRC